MTIRKRLGRVTSNPFFLTAIISLLVTALSLFLCAQANFPVQLGAKRLFEEEIVSTNRPLNRDFAIQTTPEQFSMMSLEEGLVERLRMPLTLPQNFWDLKETWYGSGEEGGNFNHPYGITQAPDGRLIVVDTHNHRIQLFEADGTFVSEWGGLGSGEGEFEYPYDAATTPDGRIFVVDCYNHRIQVFESDGTFVRQWGETGPGVGQFYYPSSIAVTLDGMVAVADTCNSRIQLFETNGTFVQQWGTEGDEDGNFRSPYGIEVAPNGQIVVADTYNHRIQVFNTNGTFVCKWGSFGSEYGEFYYPYGIAIATDGRVYIGDSWNARIQVFDNNGTCLFNWGTWGAEDGQLYYPYSVEVSSDGKTIFAADWLNDRIVVLGPVDADLDEMEDWFEVFYGLDAEDGSDAAEDADEDGLTNLEEFQHCTDPLEADTDRDGFPDASDSNATSRVYIRWGDPLFTGGDDYKYSGPAWWTAARRIGGEWQTNEACGWHVPSSESNGTNCLVIEVNREFLTNDLVMAMDFFDHTNASLYVGLADTNHAMIVSNLFGNLMTGGNALTNTLVDIPFINYPEATEIHVWRGGSEVDVYTNRLYIDQDHDGLDADQEKQLGTSDSLIDSDGDGLSDVSEIGLNTDPANPDTDGDGLFDGDEINTWPGTDPLNPDTDGDGLSDGDEVSIYFTFPYNSDTDFDGLSDGDEINVYFTNPLNPDTDNDGLRDSDELWFTCDPLDPDTDNDGLLDGEEEWQYFTCPFFADTDWDGLSDWDEIKVYFTNPNSNDTDNDYLWDADELWFGTDPNNSDTDGDGLMDAFELSLYCTDPLNPDTDGDELWDGDEVNVYSTDPNIPDSDCDDLFDGDEVDIGADPLDLDSDDDGLWDGSEVYGYDAWSVTTITSNMTWASPGTNAHWMTQWATGVVNNGFIKGGISEPINVALQLGSQIHQSMRISSDGVILLGANDSSEALAYGVNLPLSWPGISNLLAVCWDEYSLSATTGVWYEATGTGAAARVTVTWSGAKVAGFTSAEEGLDFQMEYAVSNRAFTLRYKTASGLEFPQQALFSIGAKGASANRLCRIVFNRLNVLEPGTTITITPASSCPTNTDSDADSFLDGVEADRGWNPAVQEDLWFDADGDGRDFNAEVNSYYQTDPFEVDTDGDGLTDKYETDFNLNPTDSDDAYQDYDGDGLLNYEEFCFGTHPWSSDTDGDEVVDSVEVSQGSDPSDYWDYGLAPAERYYFKPRLTTSSPLGGGGTIFKVGNYTLTPNRFYEDYNYAIIPLVKGQDHALSVYTREGFIQCPSVSTDMQVGQSAHEQVPGHDIWVCGDTVIYYPSAVFGSLGMVPPEQGSGQEFLQNQAKGLTLNGLNDAPGGMPSPYIRDRSIDVLSPGGGPVQTSWCQGSVVDLVGTSTPPDVVGTWSWSSTPNGQITSDGNTATVTLDQGVVVHASCSYGAGTTPLTTNISFSIHNNAVTFDLSPFIPVNDDDSDNNGTNDCLQAQPPAADPQIVTATVNYNKTCGCTHLQHPVLTVKCEEGASRIRVWNVDETTYQYPERQEIGGIPVTFRVEGVNASSAINDVRFSAKVEDRDNPGGVVTGDAATTVLKVDSIEASCPIADNSSQFFEGGKTIFGDPCATNNSGQSLVVFQKDARDANLVIQDFDVTFNAHIIPPSVTAGQLSEAWSKVDGPNSGNLSRTDTFEVEYQNPKMGGVYKTEFDLGLSGCAKSVAIAELPLGGPDVTAYFLSEEQRYNNWLTNMVTRVHGVTSDSFYRGLLILGYFSKTVANMHHTQQTLEAAHSPCKVYCPNTVTISGYVFQKVHIGNFLFSYLAARAGATFGMTRFGANVANHLTDKVPDTPEDQASYMAGYAHGQSPSTDFKTILESKDINAMQVEDAKRGWPSTETATGGIYPTWGATHAGLTTPD